jgi:hypothetical protein
MKNKKVIDYVCLPTTLPIIPSCVSFLMLDHFHASILFWGISIGFATIIWISVLYNIGREKRKDIFKTHTPHSYLQDMN